MPQRSRCVKPGPPGDIRASLAQNTVLSPERSDLLQGIEPAQSVWRSCPLRHRRRRTDSVSRAGCASVVVAVWVTSRSVV
jgi:hypothetical protein